MPAAAVPNLAAVTDLLGDVTATPATIAAAYAEEVEAQAAACRIPEADPAPSYPAVLAGALVRRVKVNLAMRDLPLAAAGSLPDPANVTGVAADPEVRRLEAPYRKLVVG